MPTPTPIDELTPEVSRQKAAQVAERVKQAESLATPENAARLNVPLEDLRVRVERLRDWQLQLERQGSAFDRIASLQTTIEQAKKDLETFRNEGLAEPLPYQFSLLLKLLDDRDQVSRTLDTLQLFVDTGKEALRDAQQRRGRAEEAWRRANEALKTNKDPALTPQLTREFDEALIRLRSIQSTENLRELEQRVTLLELENLQTRQTLLNEQVALVSGQVILSRQELEERLTEIQKRREGLEGIGETEGRIAEARRKAEESSREYAQARLELDKLGADATSDAKLKAEAKQAWTEQHQRRVFLLEDSLELLAQEEKLWKRLHSVLADLDRGQWAEWRTEAETFIKTEERTRTLLARAQATLRSRIIDDRRALDSEKVTAEERPHLRSRTSANEELDRAYSASLTDLDRALTLARRFVEAIAQSRVSLGERLGRIWAGVVKFWGLEVAHVGDSPITVQKIVTALLVMAFGLWLSKWFSRMLRRLVMPTLGVHVGAAAAFQKIAYYILIIIVLLVGLRVVNIPLTAFAFLGGAAAIAIGFGAQNILNNFISGLILLTEQPISIGDLIEVDGSQGTVEEIGGRSTRIRSFTGNMIYLPNSKMLETKVENWTRDPKMRISLTVGVAYGSPTRKVSKLIREACDAHGSVLRDPEPVVLFQDFGDSALNFEVFFWFRIGPGGVDGRVVRSDLRHMIAGMFAENNIEISFPQRDVHLDSSTPLMVQLLNPPVQDDNGSKPAAPGGAEAGGSGPRPAFPHSEKTQPFMRAVSVMPPGTPPAPHGPPPPPPPTVKLGTDDGDDGGRESVTRRRGSPHGAARHDKP